MTTKLCPLALLAIALCSPSWAADLIVQGKPCNSLCQDWLGVKPETRPAAAAAGVHVETDRQPVTRSLDRVDPPVLSVERPSVPPRASVPVEVAMPGRPAASPFSEAHDGALPSAEQGAAIPNLDTLVAVRGTIVVESLTDRVAKQKQIAALLKETTRATPAR